jgi:hypothetical protein
MYVHIIVCIHIYIYLKGRYFVYTYTLKGLLIRCREIEGYQGGLDRFSLLPQLIRYVYIYVYVCEGDSLYTYID